MTDELIEQKLRLWAEIAPDECVITEGAGFYGPDTFYLSSIDAILYNRMEFVGSPFNRDKFPMYIHGAVKRAIEKRGWLWSKDSDKARPYCCEIPHERYCYGNTLFEAFVEAIDYERKRTSGCTPA